MKSLLLIALVALSAVSAIRTDETRSTLAATVSAARALDTELLTNRIAHTYKTQYDLASQSELEKEDQKLLKGIKQLDKLLAKAEQQVQEQLQVVSHVKDGKASTHETHRFRADNKEAKENNNNKAAPATATAANAVGTAAAQAVSSPTATAAAAPAQQAPEPKFVYRYVPPTAKEKEKENAKAKSSNSAPTSGVSVPPTPAAAASEAKSAAPTPAAAVVPTPAAAAAAPTTSGVTAPVAAAAAAPVVKSAPEVVYKYSYTPPKASDKKVEQQKSTTAAASAPAQTQIQPQAVAAPVVSAPVPAAVAPTTPAVAQTAAVAPAQAAPAAPAPVVEKKKEELKKSDKKVAALSFAPLDSLGSVVPEAVRNSGLDAVSASTDKLFAAKAAPAKAQEKTAPTAAVAPAPPATTPAEAPGTIPATPTVPNANANAAPLKNSLGGSMANALSGSIATASLQTQSSSLASQAMATSLGVKNSPPLRRTAQAAVAANSNLAQTTTSDPAAAPSAPKGTTAYPGLHLVDDPFKAELAGHGISVLKSNHLASDASKGLTVFSPNGAADGAYTSCSCGLLPTGVCPCAGAEKPNPQPGDADPSKATPPKPAFILRTGKYDKNASPCLTLNQNCSKIDFGKEHDLPANQQRAHVRRANPVSDLPPRLIVPEKLIVPVTDNASQAVAESSSNHNEHSDDGHHSNHANEHSGEHGGSDSGAGDIPIKADPPIPLYPYDKDEMMVLNNIASIAN